MHFKLKVLLYFFVHVVQPSLISIGVGAMLNFCAEIQDRMLVGLGWPRGQPDFHCLGLTCFIRF